MGLDVGDWAQFSVVLDICLSQLKPKAMVGLKVDEAQDIQVMELCSSHQILSKLLNLLKKRSVHIKHVNAIFS